MKYSDGDTKVMYEVRIGSNEDASWEEEVFDTLYEARKRYDEINVRDLFEREYQCAAVKRSVRGFDKELACYIYRYDGEEWEPWEQPADDILDFEGYGLDDHDEIEKWDGEGWYEIVWSGYNQQRWEPFWCEFKSDLADAYLSAKRSHASEFNLAGIEFLGDGDEPNGWPGFEQAPVI